MFRNYIDIEKQEYMELVFAMALLIQDYKKEYNAARQAITEHWEHPEACGQQGYDDKPCFVQVGDTLNIEDCCDWCHRHIELRKRKLAWGKKLKGGKLSFNNLLNRAKKDLEMKSGK